MVYLIAKGEVIGRVMLVKANSKEGVKRRIKLKDGESIIGCLTTAQMQVLYEPIFSVVEA